MKKNRSNVVLGMLLALLCGSSAAQPATHSLSELLQAAVEHNPGAELVVAERDIAAALRRKADQVLADAPSANLKYQTDRIGSGLGYREWEGGVQLPLWLPGQANSYANEAERQLAVSEAMQATRLLDLAGEVRERLWSAALAHSEVENTQSARDSAQHLYADVQRRVAAGELPRSDSLLAEKALLQRDEDLQLAQNRYAQASQAFIRYTSLEPPATPLAEAVPATDELDPQHPRLQLLQREVARARAHRDRISKLQVGNPDLWLGARKSRGLAGEDYASAIGVELSMPFGTSGHRAPELAEAEAALTRAQVEHSRTRLQLQEALNQAALEYDSVRTALAQTERRRSLSDRSLNLSQRAFELGEIDLIRLLQAQNDALTARHDQQLRQLQFGQAIARLNQAAGVIPQ